MQVIFMASNVIKRVYLTTRSKRKIIVIIRLTSVRNNITTKLGFNVRRQPYYYYNALPSTSYITLQELYFLIRTNSYYLNVDELRGF